MVFVLDTLYIYIKKEKEKITVVIHVGINRFQGSKIHGLLILVIGSAVLLLSCQNEGRWYPSADVAVVSQYEYTDPASGAKALQITLVIHNTSHTSISSSTLTVQVRTDKREYLHTAASTARIIPGGKIAVNTTVTYLDADEAVIPDGVALYDAFFD